MLRDCVSHSAKAAKKIDVTSVTMNGARLNRVMAKPFRKPIPYPHQQHDEHADGDREIAACQDAASRGA